MVSPSLDIPWHPYKNFPWHPMTSLKIPMKSHESSLIMWISAMFQVRLLDGRRLRGASLPRPVPGTRSRREGDAPSGGTSKNGKMMGILPDDIIPKNERRFPRIEVWHQHCITTTYSLKFSPFYQTHSQDITTWYPSEIPSVKRVGLFVPLYTKILSARWAVWPKHLSVDDEFGDYTTQ